MHAGRTARADRRAGGAEANGSSGPALPVAEKVLAFRPGNSIFLTSRKREHGLVAQLEERLNGIEEVVSSNLIGSTSLRQAYGWQASLAVSLIGPDAKAALRRLGEGGLRRPMRRLARDGVAR